jgi:hypothetical protein
MQPLKLVAIVIMVAGVLGLAYGGFTYTKDSEKANIGPISLTVKDREHVSVPVWAGVLAVAIGGALLVVPMKKA